MDNIESGSVITFDVTTMGCKVNTYDTSLIERDLEKRGFKRTGEQPRVQIINSCAVTEKSSLETHKFVKKLRAHNPQSMVVITGCVAQVDVDRLTTLSGADLIVGNSHKGSIADIIRSRINNETKEKVFHSNIFKKDELDEGGGVESSRTRAFLKIQDGCNSFCTFCIIPFARGKSRSLTSDHLVQRVESLHQKGFQEVVLTGVHCGDYEDENLKFSDLVEKILEKTKVPRIRLSSLEPIEVDDKLWDLFKNNPRLCPHIHVSLQSANSKVLKDMKRKYGQSEIQSFFDKFSSVLPGGFIGMDVIVGFPGETQKEFEDTYEFLKANPWTKLHVFPYSIRPGTLAAKRPDFVKEKEIYDRARTLRQLSVLRQKAEAEKQLNSVKKVLILERPAYGANGLSRDYWPVDVKGDLSHYINQEVEVIITSKMTHSGGEEILTGDFTKSI